MDTLSIKCGKYGEFLYKSIDSDTVYKFIDILNNNIGNIIDLMILNISDMWHLIPNIKIEDYYTDDINIEKIHSKLDKKIINLISNFISENVDKTKIIPEKIDKVDYRQDVLVGGFDKIMAVVFGVLLFLICYFRIQNNRKIANSRKNQYDIRLINTDSRRVIYLVKMPIYSHTEVFLFKISANLEYIKNNYVKEALVYDYFKTHTTNYPSNIIYFYGAGYNTNNVRIKNKNGDDLLLKLHYQNIDNNDFWICLEYDLEYVEFCEVKDIDDTILINNILNELGELNNKYGFVHGDLKTDNVLVCTKNNTVKFFDFDFSIILGEVYNNNILTYYNQYKDTANYLLDKQLPFVKNYFYFFDVFRLLMSYMYLKNIRNDYIITFSNKFKNINVSNSLIKINGEKILKAIEIYQFTNKRVNFQERNIRYLINTIADLNDIKFIDDEFNHILHHENFVLFIFYHIDNDDYYAFTRSY